jgi:hypothetical protein
MKSIRFSTIAKTFAIVAVIALGLGITPTATAQNRGCSEATLKGIFAYTSTGYIVTAPFPPSWGRPPRLVRNPSTGEAVLPSLSIRAKTAT